MFNINTGIVPYWFVGEVVDNNDPANYGRVKVRCIGIHPPEPNDEDNDKMEKDTVYTEDLHWAILINGTYGKMEFIPDVGDWVFGFFADGRDAQHPYVIGTVGAVGMNAGASLPYCPPGTSPFGGASNRGVARGDFNIPDSVLNTPIGGNTLTPEEEEALFAQLEAQEAERRIAVGLPVEFSEAERNSIKGILASEGGNPSANLATMLNRSYQSGGAPINEIVFANKQFTPATSALTGYTDVIAGVDNAGFNRFTSGYYNPATSRLSSAVQGYTSLPSGINYFNSAGIRAGTPVLTQGNTYYIGSPGNFSNGGADNFNLFIQKTSNLAQ